VAVGSFGGTGRGTGLGLCRVCRYGVPGAEPTRLEPHEEPPRLEPHEEPPPDGRQEDVAGYAQSQTSLALLSLSNLSPPHAITDLNGGEG